MQLNIIGGSEQAKYRELNSQKTINWYPVISSQQAMNKSPIALYPTPGLTNFGAAQAGRYTRGLYTARTLNQTRCFQIIDTALWEIGTNAKYTNWGTLTGLASGSTPVYITCNSNDELFLGHPSASNVFNLDTNTMSQPVVPPVGGFPGGISYAQYLSTYIIAVSSGNTWFSNSNSALNWLGTNFFTPNFETGPVLAVVPFREEIYNFSATMLTQYLNDGSTPFSLFPRTSMSIGLAAKDGIQVFNEGMIFPGRTQEGETNIYLYDGWNNPVAISDPNIAWSINSNGSISDAYSSQQRTKDGHQLYYLTVPSINTTFVYDMSTHMWHERKSRNPIPDSNGDTKDGMFRCRYMTNFNGMNLMSDIYSTQIFQEDYSNQTENNTIIKRLRRSQTFSQEEQNISVMSCEIDCNVGSINSAINPTLMLSISRNGGLTYEQPRNLSLGLQGAYGTKAKLHKFGLARRWVVELVVTDPMDIMIQSAIAHGNISSS